jgi:anti-sigma B factor antagonist
MDIPEKSVGNVGIIFLSGRLDAYAANEVEQKLNLLCTPTQANVVVNLKSLEYISSSGLRVLLAALKKVRKQNGDIRLASLQPYVKEVFDTAGFTQLFKMFEKEEEAIDSFKGI